MSQMPSALGAAVCILARTHLLHQPLLRLAALTSALWDLLEPLVELDYFFGWV